jgi:hypothetical protein
MTRSATARLSTAKAPRPSSYVRGDEAGGATARSSEKAVDASVRSHVCVYYYFKRGSRGERGRRGKECERGPGSNERTTSIRHPPASYFSSQRLKSNDAAATRSFLYRYQNLCSAKAHTCSASAPARQNARRTRLESVPLQLNHSYDPMSAETRPVRHARGVRGPICNGEGEERVGMAEKSG